MSYENENLLSANNLMTGMFETLDTTDEAAARDAWEAAADAWDEKGAGRYELLAVNKNGLTQSAGRANVADLWDAANLFALARFSDDAHENLSFEVR